MNVSDFSKNKKQGVVFDNETLKNENSQNLFSPNLSPINQESKTLTQKTKKRVSFGIDSKSDSINNKKPKNVLTYTDFIEKLFSNSKFKVLIEKIDLPFVPTLFFSDGVLKSVLNLVAKKGNAGNKVSVLRFFDTNSRMKIFISRCFNDLKIAYLFYHCHGHVNYYHTYNEFIEKFNNQQTYKIKQKEVEFVGLFESNTENFNVENFCFVKMQETQNLSINEKAYFYHKLAFYQHFKKLKVIKDFEPEDVYLKKLLTFDKKLFMRHIIYRVFFLLQTVFEKKVENFHIGFLCVQSDIKILYIEKILVSNEEFVNTEDDEDNFEEIILNDNNISTKKRFNKFSKKKSIFENGMEDESENPALQINGRFRPIYEKINKETENYLSKICSEFDKKLFSKENMDSGFLELFPESKLKLSTVLKYEQEYNLFDDYVSQNRQVYQRKLKEILK